MNDNYLQEKWKNIEFGDAISEKEKYQISSYGRVKNFKADTIFGTMVRLHSVRGYQRLPVLQANGKKTARYIHKLVAETFLEKTDDAQQFVIHLDYDKDNNNTWNLEWATKKKKEKHQYLNPKYQTPASKVHNSKLNEGRVKMIKRKLFDPNRKTRLKIIARQFGISEMQLYRIKTGENWGYVSID